ncbi:hypothetical protein SAMN04515621_0054 [Erythrobacter sp. HL-111]|nr:MAG: hypothetical protein HLUCCO15_10880 [Erythrobacteraceae bacterium HL-111]SDR68265.1 hypothetical protein SAMN04515621_0054 [Erythrobacter sp. HL-111]
MILPPHVLRWLNGLCYWVLLSSDGSNCVCQSEFGFETEAQAKADFVWRFAIR